VDADEFYFTDTWVADDATGTVHRGDTLLALTSPVKCLYSMFGSASSGLANKEFKFELFKNGAGVDKGASQRFFSNADVGNFGGQGIVSITTGDKLALGIKQITATATTITIKHFNFAIHKL
jgi:hypothetical protein